MFSQSAIFPVSFAGQNTFVFSATRQSCKSVWRSHHQSTNSLRLWTNKPQSNSSSFSRSTVQRQSCKRALAWRHALKLKSLERKTHRPRSQTLWELDATPSPSLLSRRRHSLSSSRTMLTQLRWVLWTFSSSSLLNDEKNFFTWRVLREIFRDLHSRARTVSETLTPDVSS